MSGDLRAPSYTIIITYNYLQSAKALLLRRVNRGISVYLAVRNWEIGDTSCKI